MKITAARLLRLQGTLRAQGALFEQRQVRPIDIYPEHRMRDDFEGGRQVGPDALRIEQFFLRIETDQGPHGIAGPLPEMVATYVARRLRPILFGQDPIAHEKLWDQMHRIMVHGRQGEAMLAISAVDCALWGLKGRWLGQPVFRLLGGPTRDRVPAYASMLGFDVLDMGRVRERAAQFRDLGYPAQKWFSATARGAEPRGCATTSSWCEPYARRWARTTTSCSIAGSPLIRSPRSRSRNASPNTGRAGLRRR